MPASEGVWLVTGVQAVGKSTIADLLARQFEHGVHIRGGQFYRWACAAGCMPVMPAPMRPGGFLTCGNGSRRLRPTNTARRAWLDTSAMSPADTVEEIHSRQSEAVVDQALAELTH